MREIQFHSSFKNTNKVHVLILLMILLSLHYLLFFPLAVFTFAVSLSSLFVHSFLSIFLFNVIYLMFILCSIFFLSIFPSLKFSRLKNCEIQSSKLGVGKNICISNQSIFLTNVLLWVLILGSFYKRLLVLLNSFTGMIDVIEFMNRPLFIRFQCFLILQLLIVYIKKQILK